MDGNQRQSRVVSRKSGDHQQTLSSQKQTLSSQKQTPSDRRQK